LLKGYGQAHALRDLGVPNDEQKKDYKLNDAKTTMTVTFKSGAPRTFLVGGSVYGGSDRYVVDQQSNHAYVLSKDLISSLELGESSLHLLDPRGFEASKLAAVTIEAGGKSKAMERGESAGTDGQQVKTWIDPITKKPDQTIANFLDNTNNLRPSEYAPDAKLAELTPVLKLSFKDARGVALGTLQMFKHQKAPELPAGAELDPANPPQGETEYLIVTEKTRIPAIVRRDAAQRTEQDLETVFGDHPTSIEPKGNPLGNAPLPINPHGAPHGAAGGSGAAGAAGGSGAAGAAGGSAATGAAGGSAAAGAGSAAKPGTAAGSAAAPGASGAAAGSATKPGAASGSAAAPGSAAAASGSAAAPAAAKDASKDAKAGSAAPAAH
jgi:hypothetical protein